MNPSCVEHALSSRLYNKIVPLTGLKTIRAMYLVDKLIHIRACKRAHPATKVPLMSLDKDRLEQEINGIMQQR